MDTKTETKKTIVIIGGGASGMFAGCVLAENGHKVIILEKNEKLGKKLFITGKGRCNFTNDCDKDTFFSSVVTNPRFLYSAYNRFSPQDAISFFEKAGMKTKVERGRRAFPLSDHSWDVIDAMKRILQAKEVDIKLKSRAVSLVIDDNEQRIRGVGYSRTEEDESPEKTEILEADAVIVATGGLSYPATGSTGDGYGFAINAGHTIEKCRPSLVPFIVRETDLVSRLAGLTLKNVCLSMHNHKDKSLYEGFGELLFTHEGISGPLVLSASAYAAKSLCDNELHAFIDLKPAVGALEFDKRLADIFIEMPKKEIHNALKGVYPAVMIEPVLKIAGISENQICGQMNREMRRRIVDTTKAFPLTVTGTAGYSQAVITQGGVCVKEIDPATMESKKVKGLYFIGEVLDLDALTGGFNLQIAWSTAYAAASSLI